MKNGRLFTLLMFIALIAVVTLTVREAVATTAVVESVDSANRLFANDEGLAIYHESERKTGQVMSATSNEEGLALYHESERHSGQVSSAVSNEEGMAIYYESERAGVAAFTQRLFNGEPFNAYQRSEWLGSEQ